MRFISPLQNKFIIVIALLLIPNILWSYEFFDWYHGASEYDYALQKAIDDEDPLIIYFRGDESEWCKKLESEYLASYELNEFISDIPRVEVNPKRGPDEKNLTDKYGIKIYPSFFVFIPAFDSEFGENIFPFGKDKI